MGTKAQPRSPHPAGKGPSVLVSYTLLDLRGLPASLRPLPSGPREPLGTFTPLLLVLSRAALGFSAWNAAASTGRALGRVQERC